jgi:hypothetical protein
MNAAKRAIQFLDHLAEWRSQRRPPSDHHIIVPGAKRCRGGKPDKFAQATPHAIALHGIADLLADSKADPGRAGLRSRTGMQDERACMRAPALSGRLGHGAKIGSAF